MADAESPSCCSSNESISRIRSIGRESSGGTVAVRSESHVAPSGAAVAAAAALLPQQQQQPMMSRWQSRATARPSLLASRLLSLLLLLLLLAPPPPSANAQIDNDRRAAHYLDGVFQYDALRTDDVVAPPGTVCDHEQWSEAECFTGASTLHPPVRPLRLSAAVGKDGRRELRLRAPKPAPPRSLARSLSAAVGEDRTASERERSARSQLCSGCVLRLLLLLRQDLPSKHRCQHDPSAPAPAGRTHHAFVSFRELLLQILLWGTCSEQRGVRKRVFFAPFSD
eukprot:COSAG06_NODE_1538_length_9150_cov_102.886200_11_plen_282_part_00